MRRLARVVRLENGELSNEKLTNSAKVLRFSEQVCAFT
jgi:hypothetical protein